MESKEVLYELIFEKIYIFYEKFSHFKASTAYGLFFIEIIRICFEIIFLFLNNKSLILNSNDFFINFFAKRLELVI